MSTIHFLNVLEGDCNIIQHDNPNRISVIDVSNAYDQTDTAEEQLVKNSYERKNMYQRTLVPTAKINYRQKENPDNPIDYLKKNIRTSAIHRFILTHPDMDHLDGIRDLFHTFQVTNFWDTNNNKKITNFRGSGYNSEDWSFYQSLRSNQKVKRLTLHSKDRGSFYSEDNLQIIAPTKELIQEGNECGDYNDCSYVLLYTPPKTGGRYWKILFAGDSHNKTWNMIQSDATLRSAVSNVDILFAPHHGRDSNRNYDFLDFVRPKITLFGNAGCEHLAYDKYPPIRLTNNQAGYIILNISENRIEIFVKNQSFANDFRKNQKRNWGDAPYNANFQAWLLGYLNDK